MTEGTFNRAGDTSRETGYHSGMAGSHPPPPVATGRPDCSPSCHRLALGASAWLLVLFGVASLL